MRPTPASLLLVLSLVLAAFAPRTARAQDDAFIPPMPTDFDAVDVYLITVGRGPQVHALFGHTILRVVDRKRGVDMNFNWGIFDFADPRFVWNFYKGDLDYQLAITDFRSLREHYLLVERRGMIQERIELTARQKEALMKRLIWNAQPENLRYKYKQFHDNCATKPRDYLDEALQGRLREALDHAPSPRPFRYWIRYGAAAAWWAYIGLDMVSNDLLDQPVTPWGEMFLPERTRAHLKDLPAFDDNGDPIPGSSLLTGPTVLVPLPDPPAQRDPYAVIALVLGVPAIVVASLHLRRRAALFAPGRPLAMAFGLLVALYGLLSALWGTLLPLNWALSDYPELSHNAYLFLFWPFDWALVAYGIAVAWRGRLPGRTSKLGGFVKLLAGAHLAALALAAVLYLAGVIQQSILAGLASFGVVAAALYTALLLAARGEEA